MDTFMDQLIVFATTYGLRILGAVFILVFGRFIAGFSRRAIKRLLEKSRLDPAVSSFTANLVYILILVFTVIAALAKFGVQTTSFVAVLASAGFAVGFALQGSLSNFAAGILLLFFRPFKVGDYIRAAGVEGVVAEVKLFNTVLTSLDNIKIFVPNGKIYGDVIKNVTGHDTRRVDMVFGIGYSSSISQAFEVIQSVLKNDTRVLVDPAPQIVVAELADSSVNLYVRPWVKTSDYWDVKFAVTRKVKEKLDAEGIEIPFPQRVVHMASIAE